MRRISKTAWFGPAKATRLGVRPTGWQGVAVCFVFILLIVGDIILFKSIDSEILGGMVLGLAFVWIVYATGGRPNNDVLN